ncbi:MAG: 23S rRNA (guanosine(2251)-2'-O)-methyltransferase RlmB [Bacillota bacterium]|nr:23S rRNA (guanosine(2251)-2'-O)-methyltransferase RlmB [Bacillota bacterium]
MSKGGREREWRKKPESQKGAFHKRTGGKKENGVNPNRKEEKRRFPKRTAAPKDEYTLTDYETHEAEESANELIVYGKNAVLETLLSGAEVNKLLVIKDSRDHTVQKIIDICKEKKYPIRFADKEAIDRVESGVHQGVVLYTSPYRYADLEEILDLAERKGEPPFVVILDGITDPHNLGAIIRTAEAAGAHGVVIPKRGSAVITSTVVKISSGAAEHIAVARVGNLVSAIRELKEKGLWIVGTAPEAKAHYTNHDFKGALGIVIGSEGKGISRLVEENCDHVLRIEMYGKTSSLNASVAAGVLIFEALRQRHRDR